MNRTHRSFPSGIALLTIFALTSYAWGSSPTIFGSVTHDEQPLAGLDVILFADNGNNALDASDAIFDTTTTTEFGYSFPELDPNLGYFVVQPEQSLNGVTYSSQTSPLKRPGDLGMLIDSFEATQVVVTNPLSKSRYNSASAPNHMILGGQRDMYLEVMGGSAEAKLRSNPFSIDSVLQLDVSAGVTTFAAVTWDGVDNFAGMLPGNGLSDLDLTDGGLYDGIALRLAVDLAGEGEMVELFLHSADGGGVSVFEFPMPYIPTVTPTAFVYAPFSEFVGDADPTQVDAIQMMIHANRPSIDARFAEIGIIGPQRVDFSATIAVPEPTSAMLPAVLMAMAFCRRGHRSGGRH